MKLKITAADSSEEKLFYACDEESVKAAKIGHLRIDFGSGRQFYNTWFESNAELNDETFKAEFNKVIDTLCKDLLKDRYAMGEYIRSNPSLDLGDGGNGFKVQTDEHTYYLRCKPQPGDYECYCFCYERDLLEQAMAQTDSEAMTEENIGMEI